MQDVNAGEFDEVIALYTVTRTRGAKGQLVETLTRQNDIYAKILHRMSDSIDDENDGMDDTVTIECWKNPAINTKWSAEWNGNKYNIVSIDMGDRISPFMTMTMERQ